MEKHQLKSNESFVQKNCEVLIENKSKNKNSFFGRTKFMTPVKVESDNCKIGEKIDVKVTSSNKNNLFGFYNSNEEKAA